MKANVHFRTGFLHLVGRGGEVVKPCIGGPAAAGINQQAQHPVIGRIIAAAQPTGLVHGAVRQEDIVRSVGSKSVVVGHVTVVVVGEGGAGKTLGNRRPIEEVVVR